MQNDNKYDTYEHNDGILWLMTRNIISVHNSWYARVYDMNNILASYRCLYKVSEVNVPKECTYS